MTEAPRKSMYAPREHEKLMVKWQANRISELEHDKAYTSETVKKMISVLVDRHNELMEKVNQLRYEKDQALKQIEKEGQDSARWFNFFSGK